MTFKLQTKMHFGTNKPSTQGVQFRAVIVEHETDTADEVRAMDCVIRAIRADINELGYAVYFIQREIQLTGNGGGAYGPQNTPLSRREIALKAQLTSAQQEARNWRERFEKLRKDTLRVN